MTQKGSVLEVEDIDGSIRLLTLNRPEARNAFNDELYRATQSALEEASANVDIATCIITGSGDVYSAGQDWKDIDRARSDLEAGTHPFGSFARTLALFDKPLLAAVNGPAVGVGMTMLLHCDLVFVSEAARFRAPFVALGIVPEAGSSVLLPQRVGSQAATGLLFTGDWMDAREAVAAGLAWRSCAAESVLNETIEFAKRMVKQSHAALKATKRLLLAARHDAVLAAIDREVDEVVQLIRASSPGT